MHSHVNLVYVSNALLVQRYSSYVPFSLRNNVIEIWDMSRGS